MTTHGKPQREPNPCSVEHKKEDAYEVWEVIVDGEIWTHFVLKKWKSPTNEAKDRYARWFCAVQSPITYPGYDLGDCYAADVKRGRQLSINPLTGKPVGGNNTTK